MDFIGIATINHLDEVVKIDAQVIGNDSRRFFIKEAIEENRCVIASDNNQIKGFLIYDTHFYECSFISLLLVKPEERRKGYATSLIKYFIVLSPTIKIFSSTNQSNKTMQQVFKANGFIKSGFIDNLDEGDLEIIYFKSRLP